MMVKWQVGADHRSQRLSSLLHSGRTRTPGSDVWYFCSPLRAVKTEKIVLDNTQSNYYLLFNNYS